MRAGCCKHSENPSQVEKKIRLDQFFGHALI